MKQLYFRTKTFIEQYERFISPMALLTGFVVDNLTLRRIDLLVENLIFAAYIAIAGTGILLLNLYMGGRLHARFFERIVLWIPVIIQFVFGGLFSGFVVFYSRSTSLITSWPFLAVLAALLVGNELFRKYYARLVFQISVFFFVLMSFSIFFLPIVVGAMGTLVFFASCVLSVIATVLFVRLLARLTPKQTQKSVRPAYISITAIFLFVSILYFANAIPPIPLSLKDSGIYYSVAQTTGGYVAEREAGETCRWLCFRDSIKIAPGQSVYAYSAVFAPTRISTTVSHRWQYRGDDGWVTASVIPFPIRGGRDGGYRGYTAKTNVFPGKWRVDVVTGRGQVIGRIRFDIEQADMPPPTTENISLQ